MCVGGGVGGGGTTCQILTYSHENQFKSQRKNLEFICIKPIKISKSVIDGK